MNVCNNNKEKEDTNLGNMGSWKGFRQGGWDWIERERELGKLM